MASVNENRLMRTIAMAAADGQAGPVLVTAQTNGDGGIGFAPSVNDAIKGVSGAWAIVGRNHPWLKQITGYANPDAGGTTRRMHVACGQITALASLFATHFWAVDGNGGWVESTPTAVARNSNIFKVGYEAGGVTTLDTFGARVQSVVEPDAPVRQTDGVGVQIAAGSSFGVRVDMRIAVPPTSATATPIAGGSLAAQQWNYTVTRVRNGVESGPIAEFSGTTSAGNLSILIAIVDADSANADYYLIYRSATPGGTKYFLGSTPGRAKRFVDDGTYTPDTTITPPAASLGQLNTALLSNQDCESYVGGFSDGSDKTSLTGTFGTTGPGLYYGRTVACLLGITSARKSALLLADSIGAGKGFADSSVTLAQLKNFWDASFSDGEMDSCNAAFAGATLKGMFVSTLAGGARSRLKLLRHAHHVVDELGTNDLATGVTWTQLAAYKLLLAKTVSRIGGRYYTTTILPRTTTTDGCVTIAGQSLPAYEAGRQNFNAWVRGGCQIDGSGAPVISGGTPSPDVAGTLDIAAAVEADATGAAVVGGGYWQVPSAPILTGQVLTGTPTATSLPVGAAAYSVNGLISYVIKMTSGAQAGKFAVVLSNTANSVTVYGSGNQAAQSGVNVPILSGAPAAGDTFDVYATLSNEGTHPAVAGHAQIASSACRPFLLSKVINA